MLPKTVNWFCFILLLTLLSGCATHSELRKGMVDEVRMGEYKVAYKTQQKLMAEDARKDLIMDLMDKAMLLHLQGKYQESNEVIEEIKLKFDDLFSRKWKSELAALAWNDSASDFQGEEFEGVMIHAISAFNYLHLNDLENAAVEARQINFRLQVYVDRLKKNKVNTSYTQDPFAQYLSGMIQEAMQEYNDAFRSYEDSLTGYEKIGRIMEVSAPDSLKAAVLRCARLLGHEQAIEKYEPLYGDMPESDPAFWEGKSKLVVIAGLGEVAHKVSKKWIVPDPEFDTIVVTYPAFERGRFKAGRAIVNVDEKQVQALPVHDLSTLAIKMLDDKNSQVKARAIARAILMYAAKKVTKTIAKNTKNNTVKALSFIANIALNVTDIVKEADTRSWMTLPDHYSLAEIPVEPGTKEVSVVIEGNMMRDVQKFTLPFYPDESRFLVVRAREPGSPEPDKPAEPVDTIKPGAKKSEAVSMLVK